MPLKLGVAETLSSSPSGLHRIAKWPPVARHCGAHRRPEGGVQPALRFSRGPLSRQGKRESSLCRFRRSLPEFGPHRLRRPVHEPLEVLQRGEGVLVRRRVELAQTRYLLRELRRLSDKVRDRPPPDEHGAMRNTKSDRGMIGWDPAVRDGVNHLSLSPHVDEVRERGGHLDSVQLRDRDNIPLSHLLASSLRYRNFDRIDRHVFPVPRQRIAAGSVLDSPKIKTIRALRSEVEIADRDRDPAHHRESKGVKVLQNSPSLCQRLRRIAMQCKKPHETALVAEIEAEGAPLLDHAALAQCPSVLHEVPPNHENDAALSWPRRRRSHDE